MGRRGMGHGEMGHRQIGHGDQDRDGHMDGILETGTASGTSLGTLGPASSTTGSLVQGHGDTWGWGPTGTEMKMGWKWVLGTGVGRGWGLGMA